MSLDERISAASDGLRDRVAVDAASGLARLRRTHRQRQAARAGAVVSAAVLVALAATTWLGRPEDQQPKPAAPMVRNGMLLSWSGAGVTTVGGDLEHQPPDVPVFGYDQWIDIDPHFSFSADGSELFYVTSGRHVVAFEHATGNVRDLGPCPTQNTAWVDWCLPAVSPDGESVAFADAHGITISGQAANSLELGDMTGAMLAWSPDGSRIAFPGASPGSTRWSSLYVVRADGSGLRRVATPKNPEGLVLQSTWSPDGRSLAYVTQLQHEDKTFRFHVQTVDLESGRVRRLAGAGRCITCSGPSPVVAWSPDGRQLAFTTYQREVRLMSASGGATRRASLASSGQDLAWQPVWVPASAP